MKKISGITFVKTAYLGMFLSFALILSYVESVIPVIIPVPGIKLGLANAFVMLLFYLYGPKEAAIISFLRVLLNALLFTGFYAMIYSLSGAVVSFVIMSFMYRRERVFSPIGVGMAGRAVFKLAQIAVAFLVTHTQGLWYYLPILITSGLITGGVIGFLVKILISPLKAVLKQDKKTE